MVVRKSIILTSLSLVSCASLIAGFGLWQYLNKPASIEISGLDAKALIELEYGCLGEEPEIYQGTAKSFNELVLDLPEDKEKETYYVLSKLPDNNDVNIQVNPKKREITITAEGFDDSNVMTVEVEGRIVAVGEKPDWSGKFEYSHSYNEKFGINPLVCLDVGGYRGSSMSICHTARNKQLVHVQAGGGGTPENFAHLILQNWVKGMMLMAKQMTAVIVSATEQIGRMIDSKHQLETQRLFQEKSAEALRDYYPSEQICKIGTVMRDMAMIDERMPVTRNAINNQIRSRELISGEAITKEAGTTDVLSRINMNKTVYCNKNDGGMSRHCTSAEDSESNSLENDGDDEEDPAQRMNKDIDYIRTIELPLTLDIDFLEENSGGQKGDDTGPAAENKSVEKTTSDETDVFQLLHSLFSDENFPRFADGAEKHEDYTKIMRNMRSVVAMRGVARNSVANIIAQKAASANKENDAGPYLKALMKEMGVEDTKAIEKILGKNPSYFAKMEVLTKKLYQDPNFYANLYDKPANVSRMRTAMKAIKLIQDRDIYAAMQRREMLLAMLLELRVRELENPSSPEGER